MIDEHSDASARLLQELVDFDESLAEGSTWTDSGDPVPDGFDEEEAALLVGAMESLALIETVRQQDPTLFDPSEHKTAVASSATIGRFQVIRELGRGGCGVVLLVRDPNLNRHVALKVPLPEVVLSAEMRQRFLREGKAAAALRHPNIVSVFEAAEVGPICYLVSEYCEGPSLAAWLRDRSEPVEPRIAAMLVRDLARALQHAHEQGVIHCDLKPGNILLEPAETPDAPLRPRITDFGMARLLEADGDQTRTGSVLGTPAYMAPEQAAGNRKAVGPATDIFSLGVILYELLSGRRPFQRESILATLHAIQHEGVIETEDRSDPIPQELDDIVQRCLAKKPSDRYATAIELANDLDRVVAGETTAARATHAGKSRTEQRSRSRIKMAAAVIGAAGLAAALIAVAPDLLSTGEAEQVGDQSTSRSTPAPPAQSAVDRAAPPVDEDDARNRRVCEWILKEGGQVGIPTGYSPSRLLKPKDVPHEPFQINFVLVANHRSINETQFQDLLDLPDCTEYLFVETLPTDDQMRRLVEQKGGTIERLMLYATGMTDNPVQHVHSMATLEYLTLRSGHLTDASLPSIGGLNELRKLEILFSQITDDGLRHLSGLSGLKELNLGYSANVSDAGLKHLYPLTSLRKLNLTGTAVTGEGVAAFLEQAPGCEVELDAVD